MVQVFQRGMLSGPWWFVNLHKERWKGTMPLAGAFYENKPNGVDPVRKTVNDIPLTAPLGSTA